MTDQRATGRTCGPRGLDTRQRATCPAGPAAGRWLVQNLSDMVLVAWRYRAAHYAAARRLDVPRPIEFHPQLLFLVEIIDTPVSGSALLASISRGLGAGSFSIWPPHGRHRACTRDRFAADANPTAWLSWVFCGVCAVTRAMRGGEGWPLTAMTRSWRASSAPTPRAAMLRVRSAHTYAFDFGPFTLTGSPSRHHRREAASGLVGYSGE